MYYLNIQIFEVEILMQLQQIKYIEDLFGHTNNYSWLINKEVPTIWMSIKDEIHIRRSLIKVRSKQTKSNKVIFICIIIFCFVFS